MTIAGGWGCSVPSARHDRVTLAHGGGGTLMQSLFGRELAPLLPPASAPPPNDAAWIPLPDGGDVAMTTDSFVIRPLFFPGGDIGTLAVNGTLNDLAVCAARPIALSVGLILEEGLPMDMLSQVAASLRTAADAAGVRLATGDTKVVERRTGDTEPGLFINTTGIGTSAVPAGHRPHPSRIRPGDAILVTGSIARHGIAVMADRHGLQLSDTVSSDCASLVAPLMALFAAGIDIHCARDATRSGLGGILCELSNDAALGFRCEEQDIPVRDPVARACEVLGFDPLFVANEGCAALFLSANEVSRALEILHGHPVTSEAALIGTVREGADVVLRTPWGTERLLTPPLGDQLPRIC